MTVSPTKKMRVAYILILIGGVGNIASGLIHVFLPQLGNWKEILRDAPDKFVPIIAVSSKAYFYSQNYEIIFVCCGGGILSLIYAKRLLQGDTMVAWFSIWCGITLLYRATTHFFFFGVSLQTIIAFMGILSMSLMYLFPVLVLKEMKAVAESPRS
jgi:hypothetical protein